jgi:uncharacterized protein YndB with AHSA1/START domain
MVPDRVEREIVIDAPINVVWAVLTEPDHVSGWFGDTAEIDLRPGGSFTHHWEGPPRRHTEHGRVDRVEPPRYLSYRWFRDADTREEHATLVEFTLTEEGARTRLRVLETGFSKLDWPEDKQTDDFEGHREGWEQELDALRDYAEGLKRA